MSLVSDILRQNHIFAVVGASQDPAEIVWMPPGAWSDKAVEACVAHGIQEVNDVCPVFTLDFLKE